VPTTATLSVNTGVPRRRIYKFLEFGGKNEINKRRDRIGFAGTKHCVERCGDYSRIINGNKAFKWTQLWEVNILLCVDLEIYINLSGKQRRDREKWSIITKVGLYIHRTWDQRMNCNIIFWRKLKNCNLRYIMRVVQIWPGLFVCKQVTVCPGHIWTTL
jgi:hypothetical protein